MNIEGMRQAVTAGRVHWRAHALKRMLERCIGTAQVEGVLLDGEMIEDYPDDFPLPSALLVACSDGRLLHVVVAYHEAAGYAFVVTAYEADDVHFEPDYRTRKTQ